MKKLILSILLGSVAVSGYAATANVTATSGATNSILTRPSYVSQIVIQNAGATTNNIKFFDAPSARLWYTNDSYTTFTNYTSSITNVYTNSTSGITFTNIYNALTVASSTVAASTNNLPGLTPVLSIPPGNTTYTPQNGLQCNFGLTCTNNATFTVTVTYSSQF